MFTPLITPVKLNVPEGPSTNEPGGTAMVKLLICSVTVSSSGSMPLLLAPRVKLIVMLNNGWYEEIDSLAVMALNGVGGTHAWKKIGSLFAIDRPKAAPLPVKLPSKQKSTAF